MTRARGPAGVGGLLARKKSDSSESDEDPDADRSGLVVMLAGRGALSTSQVADLLAVSLPEARLILTALVEDGRLEKVGRTKGTRYVLPGTAD